jgi:pyridoxal phosphate enzyme (YggS family)
LTGFAERLVLVRARIARACAVVGRDPGEVELLAVSKTHPAESVREALAAGQTAFGENRVQELVPKAEALAGTRARWHLIGSLQTNKVRSVCALPALVLLHSLDRPKLVAKLAEACAGLDRDLEVLLQVNATGEEQKHGVRPADAEALAREVLAAGPRLSLSGLMAMGPVEGDPAPAFAAVARLRAELRDVLGLPLPVLSLGMSGDLEQGIAAGSTLVRVGTDLFGARSG